MKKLTRRNFIRKGALLVPAVYALPTKYARAGTVIIPGPMARHSVLAGNSSNPELNDWISRVQGQSSDTTTDERTMAGTFIIALKDANIRTKTLRIGIYLGNDLNALKAPLINDGGATTDILTGFVSGDYTSNGLTGSNGKRIETGYGHASSGADSNSIAIAIYNRTASNSTATDMGSGSNGDSTKTLLIEISAGGTTNGFSGDQVSGHYTSTADSNGTGLYVNSRIASNDLRMYKNGTQLGSTVTGGVGGFSDFNIWVHNANLSASQWVYSTRQFCFYGIFKGLTSSEVSALYTAVQALQTSRGRQV